VAKTPYTPSAMAVKPPFVLPPRNASLLQRRCAAFRYGASVWRREQAARRALATCLPPPTSYLNTWRWAYLTTYSHSPLLPLPLHTLPCLALCWSCEGLYQRHG